jgi:anti-sigma-K factor RskA
MSTDGDQSSGAGGDNVLVGEFVLGLLSADEHAATARRIAGDPALGRELQLWQSRLSGLDREFAETTPPADLLHRIEARLFPQPSVALRHSGFWGSLSFWRGLAAAGFAVAIIAVGFNLVPRAPLSGPELVAALEAQGSNVKFVAFYDQNTGRVRLAALSGDAVPNKDFELWAIKGKDAPVSMGVIPVNAKSDIPLSDALKQGFAAGTVLAVTLEQKGGSPTGAPQGPVVAAGPAVSI